MHMTDFQKSRDIACVTPFNSRDVACVTPLAVPGQQSVADRCGTCVSLSSIGYHTTCRFDRDLRAVRARIRRAARLDHGPRRRLGNTIGRRPHLQPEGKASEPRRVPIARLNALLVSKPRHLPKCTHEMYPRGRHRARLAAHDPMMTMARWEGPTGGPIGRTHNHSVGPWEGGCRRGWFRPRQSRIFRIF